MSLFRRVKRILFKPREEWEIISEETTTIPELYGKYIMILAAIRPVAFIIRAYIVDSFFHRIPITVLALLAFFQYYILPLVGVCVLALLINAFAPIFSGKKSINQAFRVATYSSTPGWLAGIFAEIPMLTILVVLGLYSLYLLYLGLPILMQSPRQKSLRYTITVMIAAIVIVVVLFYIFRVFIHHPIKLYSIPRQM